MDRRVQQTENGTEIHNFFRTESSGNAPFFLMFGCEAAVKHTLLASESPRYVGPEDSLINVELMTKLYLVIAHNLNKARKSRDSNKVRKIKPVPKTLKVGDNILVRDHTSKVFQPKYRSGTVNSKSFVGKVLLRIKRKFELIYAL